jgi:hypothetical protein
MHCAQVYIDEEFQMLLFIDLNEEVASGFRPNVPRIIEPMLDSVTPNVSF